MAKDINNKFNCYWRVLVSLQDHLINYPGVRKRVESLIGALDSKNYSRAAGLLRSIALENLHIYSSLPDSAFFEILEYFGILLNTEEKQEVMRTLLEFTEAVERREVREKSLELLENHFSEKEAAKNSSYFKSCLGDCGERGFALAKSALSASIALWQKDLKSYGMSSGKSFFDISPQSVLAIASWDELKKIPSYTEIAESVRDSARRLKGIDGVETMLSLAALESMENLADHLIWDASRNIYLLESIGSEDIKKIFSLLAKIDKRHMGAVLDCILALGKKACDLCEVFVDELIDFGFVYPGKTEIGEDWEVVYDRNHVKCIRVWLELFELEPKRMEKILLALIVNLRAGGVFIPDKELFQKDVSKLLNSEINADVKHLARLFPVYYTEIGAAGELRETTTAIDELTYREDKLVHFLRKQVHVESSPLNLELAKRVLEYWYTGDKSVLAGYAPEELIDEEMQKGIGEILRERFDSFESLLECHDFAGPEERDAERIRYMLKLYHLLKAKYALGVEKLSKDLKRFGGEDVDLDRLFGLLKELKEKIESKEKTEGREDIYYKRHIAAGMPSMYGGYYEPKFEALGLSFRIESFVSSEILEEFKNINPQYLTIKKLKSIKDLLSKLILGLELEGFPAVKFRQPLDMLEHSFYSPSFSVGQYLNIFQFFSESFKETINSFFIERYDPLLKRILPRACPDKNIEGLSEKFYRDSIASTFCLQELDLVISETLSSLRRMMEEYDEETCTSIVSYDPELMISSLFEATPKLDNPIFLGSKAFRLKELYSSGIPVPPGFVLTTELFRHMKALSHPGIDREISLMLEGYVRKIEELSGKKFGDKDNPLLFSVRSGTAISMPGAMITFLNVGLNDEITEAFSKRPGFEWSAWDSYRRLLQSWGMANGVDRDCFDRIIEGYKERYGVKLKMNFTPEQMREISFAYKNALIERGIRFEEDPFRQLREAAIMVANSWDSERAMVYRQNFEIADEWGTAVIVQKMVFGNKDIDSGTGVLFTHAPREGKKELYGDFIQMSQGEDVVSGLVHTHPISEQQRIEEGGEASLEHFAPEIYARLLQISEAVLDVSHSPQEIEFTFESKSSEDLYILQSRDLVIPKKMKAFLFAEGNMELIGSGIGIGEALNGIVVFDMEDIERFQGENLVLVRPDTVPDDIALIMRCQGLLTSRGGATSHAAVTAARLGKVCVVNCRDMRVYEKEKRCIIGSTELRTGDKVALDGLHGKVYRGHYPLTEVYDRR